MHAVDNTKTKWPQRSPNLNDKQGSQDSQLHRALIVDAMAVLQGMKRTQSMKKLSDLQEAFINCSIFG